MSTNLPVVAYTPIWTFDPTDRIDVDGTPHRSLEFDQFGHVMCLADNQRIIVSFTHEEIQAFRDAGKLKVTRFAFLRGTARRELVTNEASLVDFSPSKKRQLFYRVHMCHGIMKLEADGQVSRTDKSLGQAIPAIFHAWLLDDIRQQTADGRCGARMKFPALIPPSASTLRRWLRQYESCDLDILALAPGYGKSGNRNPRLPENVRELVDCYARKYISRLRPSKALLYRDLVAEIDRQNVQLRKRNQNCSAADRRSLICVPCRATFLRAIAKLNPFEVLAGRHGEEYARRKFAIVQGGLYVTRPLERVEMDEWKMPIKTILENAGIWSKLSEQAQAEVEKETVWLHTAIDCTTRIVMAARIIRTPSAAAAIETLNMSVNDKGQIAAMAGCEMPWNQCGIAGEYATDNGNFRKYDFRAAVTDLGSTHVLMLARAPGMRGTEERLYRTLHSQLISRIAGRTFENVVAKGDYDSVGNVVLDMEELGRAIIRFIVDVYHLTPHAGLGGMTPLDKWIELRRKYAVVPPPHPDVNRHIFGVSLQRRIGNHGVRILGLYYQSEDLQRVRYQVGQKPVLVRIDPLNLGSISLRSDAGWLTVQCVRPGMKNVPLVQWLLAAAELRRTNAAMAKVHEPTMLRALRDIQGMADAAISRANIAAPILSERDIARFEKGIFQTFGFSDEGDGSLDALNFDDNPGEANGATVTHAEYADSDLADDAPWFGVED